MILDIIILEDGYARKRKYGRRTIKDFCREFKKNLRNISFLIKKTIKKFVKILIRLQ